MAAAGAGRSMMNSRSFSQLQYGRLIPKRGQVKVAIVLGLAHSFASIFSFRSRRGGVPS
ncbi:conserved hypothetical protein [Ricinus communis]|uniref:Uncharacterized protein n=1 Tax=Ricinus communis TaxID=3988 RepID=B9S601_RICCO|nr:conserved hypothetical protein [Ricinus communis]